MKFVKIFVGSVLAMAATAAMAQPVDPLQENKGSIKRIKIRKADPELIMRLLAGSLGTMQPEWSTILNSTGRGGFGSSGFGGGSSGFSGNGSGQSGRQSGSGRPGPSGGG